jgi:hypothetical protein
MRDAGSREELRRELDRIASEIDEGLLAFASPEARREWTALWSRWQAASTAATHVDDDLVVDVQKVRRFSAILRALRADGRIFVANDIASAGAVGPGFLEHPRTD